MLWKSLSPVCSFFPSHICLRFCLECRLWFRGKFRLPSRLFPVSTLLLFLSSFSYSCSCTSNTKNDRTEMNKQNDLRPLQNVLVSIKDVQGIVRLLSSNLLHRFEPIVYNDQFTCCIHLCIVGYSVWYWYLFERRESWTIDGTKSLRVRSENVCPSQTEKKKKMEDDQAQKVPTCVCCCAIPLQTTYAKLGAPWWQHSSWTRKWKGKLV